MSALPAELSTGMVHGRFIVAMIDGNDDDQEPDVIPASGKIVFKAGVPYVPVPATSEGPVTVLKGPITGVLDSEGYLCTPHPVTGKPMYVGVKLLATDDPDMAVTDWTWTAEYRFDSVGAVTLAVPAHSFALPSGTSVDLTTMVKVPSSPGYGLPQAEAAALRAEAISQSIRDDADNGVFNGEAATLGIGSVVSGPTAGVINVGDEQHAILNITLEKGDKGDTGNGVPDAGEAFQLIRMDEIAGTTEWVTPSKELVGLAQVDNTSDANKPVSNATQIALAAKADLENGKIPDAQTPAGVTSSLNGKVSKGDLYTNAKDYGAVGNGIVDDTEALNAAANAAYAKSQDSELFIPPGVYRISDTVIIRTGLMASQAEFRYYGTGNAVQLGTNAPGSNLVRKSIRLPRVIQYTNSYNPTTHDGTSVGVLALNLISCDLYVPFIQWFEDGLVMHGLSAGCGYNTIYLQSLWGNHRGLVISSDGPGWTNQNVFLGGRISPASWYENDVDGTFITLDGGNQNLFLGVSLEGAGEYLHRVKFFAARYNTFISPRFESLGWAGKPGILWGTGSNYNRIEGGYNTLNMAETFEAGTVSNTIRSAQGPLEFRSNRANALSIPASVSTAINTWSGVNGFQYAYDDASGVFTPRQGRWQVNVTVGLSFSATGGYADVKIVSTTGTVLALQRYIPVNSEMSTISVSARRTFAQGEGFKIEVDHTSTGDVSLSTSAWYCQMQAEYLGW